MNIDTKKHIIIGAVGDIAFVGKRLERPSEELFKLVQSEFKKCDLIIGNLECPLLYKGKINTEKCTLRGNPEWAHIMKTAGIDYLSLANNHMMDYGIQGLKSTWRSLSDAGILFSGSGNNIEEAVRPEIIEVRGRRIAILAYSSVIVASQCYAKENKPGVAYFEQDEALKQIACLRPHVDFIVLCIHWGIEHYSYPTPKQRGIARILAGAGVDLIIGHHPHTLQGSESIYGSVVVYSLGNFIFDNFEWERISPNGSVYYTSINLSENNRIGSIFRVSLGESSVLEMEHFITRFGSSSKIEWVKDDKPKTDHKKLSKLFSIPAYKYLWKIYSLYMEWQLRLRSTISVKKILKDFRKIRPRQFKRFFEILVRSIKIVTGKSTNPYE